MAPFHADCPTDDPQGGPLFLAPLSVTLGRAKHQGSESGLIWFNRFSHEDFGEPFDVPTGDLSSQLEAFWSRRLGRLSARLDGEVRRFAERRGGAELVEGELAHKRHILRAVALARATGPPGRSRRASSAEYSRCPSGRGCRARVRLRSGRWT